MANERNYASEKKVTLDDFSDELVSIFNDFARQSFEVRQKAVQKGAEKFVDILKPQTPRKTGKLAESWVIKDEIPDRRYVGNTATARGSLHRKENDSGMKRVKTVGEARTNVPLVNVLEYGAKSPHKGFFTGAFDGAESEIFDAIKSEFEKEG